MRDDAAPFRDILLIKHHRRPPARLLANAVDLARRSGARLTFAHALEGAEAIDDSAQRERLRELEATLSPHLEEVRADYLLLSGDLADAAREAATSFDLIIPAEVEAGSERARRDLTRLLRRSPLPVWVDRGPSRPLRRVLAAVDVQTSNPAKLALNGGILRRALHLAAAFDAELDVLSVRTPPVTSELLARRLAGETGTPMPTRRETRTRVQELLAEAGDGAPELPAEPRVMIAQGDPDTLIAQAAESASVDLLVAGCLGRDGLARWLVGDTTERLSRRLDCSILAVKLPPEPADGAAAGERSRAA